MRASAIVHSANGPQEYRIKALPSGFIGPTITLSETLGGGPLRLKNKSCGRRRIQAANAPLLRPSARKRNGFEGPHTGRLKYWVSAGPINGQACRGTPSWPSSQEEWDCGPQTRPETRCELGCCAPPRKADCRPGQSQRPASRPSGRRRRSQHDPWQHTHARGKRKRQATGSRRSHAVLGAARTRRPNSKRQDVELRRGVRAGAMNSRVKVHRARPTNF